MPVNYGLLRGSVIDSIPYQKGADHFQIEINAAGTNYRIAVDVYSGLSGSANQRDLLYYKDEQYTHPILSNFPGAATGFTPGHALPKPLLLDYLRYNPALFPLNDMKIVPPKDAGGNGDDLNDDIGPWIKKATNNPNAEVFAFGSGWDDSQGGTPDPTQYFHPNPSKGIHDIHMNQGDSGHEAQYNGIWQDGGLFIHFTGIGGASDQWVAMFFRFQDQSTHTDNQGNPA